MSTVYEWDRTLVSIQLCGSPLISASCFISFCREAVGDGKTYAAMTQAEIEDWLEHIPVFAVTDSSGSGVVLRPDNDTSVFYFFMSPMQANATLQQLKGGAPEMDLKVSAFSLGKIWFSLLQDGADTEVTVSFILINLFWLNSL